MIFFTFLQNYSVKSVENLYSNSLVHSEQESIGRISKPIKEIFFMSVRKWDMICVRMHFYTWGEFAIHFLQNYTVKIFEN